MVFRSYNHHPVAHLQGEIGAGKEVHALTGDASYVNTIDRREVHLAECLAIDGRTRHENALGNHRLFLVHFLPSHLYFGADERYDGFSVGFCAHYKYLIANLKHRVALRNDYVSVAQQPRAHEVTVEKVVYLSQRPSCQIGVCHLKMHVVGLHVCVFRLLCLQLFLLVTGVDAADEAQGYRCADDAQHSQGVGTGIAGGYLRYVALGENALQRLVGSTETGGVGHSTIQCAHHHGQVVRVFGVEKDEVTGKHHGYIQQHYGHRKQVQCDATLAETLEKAGTYLQTYHKDKQYKTEILQESQYVCRGGHADVAGKDACEQHKRHSKRYASELYFTKKNASCYHYGIEHCYVSHGVGSSE